MKIEVNQDGNGGVPVKAWERSYLLRKEAKPAADFEMQWDEAVVVDLFPDSLVKTFWKSVVPGSGAPESLVLGAVQAVENMGKDVSEAEKLLEEGFKAFEKGDSRKLKSLAALIFHVLSSAKDVPDHPYHSFKRPVTWEEISAEIPEDTFEVAADLDSVHGGWLGQIAGASMGTALEGYLHQALVELYGDRLGFYVGEVSTYNDDITYEIALLEAVKEKGRGVDSKDIALKWIEMIPFGWSAELVALENLRRGIFPPDSGRFNNPFQEWIGAQMRTMVCGLLCPGKPKEAARLAFLDSQISHSGNGIYGGIHSAVITSLAFVFEDVREILKRSVDYVPKGSEFRYYLELVLSWCESARNWENVMEKSYQEFKRYNWIHVYPNMAAVVTGLWFGNGDFDETMKIIASFGYDVDCNAGEAGTVLGVILGAKGIPERWIEPFKDELRTYLPGFETISISELSRKTLELSELLGGVEC